MARREWCCHHYSEWDMELLEMLMEAEVDVTNGRIMPIQDTFNDLRVVLKGKWNVYTEYIVGKIP